MTSRIANCENYHQVIGCLQTGGTTEASTEKAIEGEFDDRAMTIVIGLAALKWKTKQAATGKGFAQQY